jgi:hypothetical protein
MCDDHPDVLAVARVQGETDSFGSELMDLCQACVDEMNAYAATEDARSGCCDWCKSSATDLRNRRDADEGMSGPVYRVCGACVKRENDAAHEELDYDDDWLDRDYD